MANKKLIKRIAIAATIVCGLVLLYFFVYVPWNEDKKKEDFEKAFISCMEKAKNENDQMSCIADLKSKYDLSDDELAPFIYTLF